MAFGLGVTYHTATETMQLLQASFPERVISRPEEVIWPPKSYDLTPLDFFLWGFLYANNSRTVP